MTIAQIDALIVSLADNVRNPASRVRTILTAIKNEAFPLNEIKMIFMTDIEIAANFDSTGLGIGNSVGKAIANGLNGTQNYCRKVPVGYDSTPFVSGFDYSTVGNAFGLEKHTLALDEVPLYKTFLESGAGGSSAADFADDGNGSTTPASFSIVQPSKVTLFIQRIS